VDGYRDSEEEVVFYGAARANVGGFVREGFEVPWDDIEKYREKRPGGDERTPWGMGVYTYPNSNHALKYVKLASCTRRVVLNK